IDSLRPPTAGRPALLGLLNWLPFPPPSSRSPGRGSPSLKSWAGVTNGYIPYLRLPDSPVPRSPPGDRPHPPGASEGPLGLPLAYPHGRLPDIGLWSNGLPHHISPARRSPRRPYHDRRTTRPKLDLGPTRPLLNTAVDFRPTDPEPAIALPVGWYWP